MFAKKSQRRPSARPIAVLESMDCRRYCDGDDRSVVGIYTVKIPGTLKKN